MNQETQEFLDSLTPSDVGFETIGETVIRFEGFTDECWADASRLGKTAENLVGEILEEWGCREGVVGSKLVEFGWWTSDIFFGIYKCS